ncbi:hypothetical protein [Demequina aurantiaca]|uniref:hypothetical protein n=1 Tax=Demequina aurantiaca TaxID=676200 RepID=UPI000782F8EA|nr:hypothetical protein [Demequina aurantiaca]
MDNVQKLDIEGARDTVEVDGVFGVFYKIRVGGEVVRRGKGGWDVPMRNGSTSKLTARGLIPGFQKLYLDNTPIYAMGAHVDLGMRILMFLPFILILINYFLGLVLALVLFFLNISVVKNPHMPAAVRIILPVANTLAGGLLLFLLAGLLYS